MDCLNRSNKEISKMIDSFGEVMTSKLLDKFSSDVIPSFEEVLSEYSNINTINYNFKSVEILSSDKAKQVFAKGEKANWNLDKILTELQIPKEQKELLLNLNITEESIKSKYDFVRELENNSSIKTPSLREELALELASNYSFAVEINTAKTNINSGGAVVQELDDIYVPSLQETFYFSYRDGWFKEDRNQDRIIATKEELKAIEEYKNKDATQNSAFYSNLTVPGGTNYTENEIATPAVVPSIKGHAQFSTENGIGWFRSDEQVDDKNPNKGLFQKYGKELPKTRRILEVQSDLFQKGRDKDWLNTDNEAYFSDKDTEKNQFLQLLNKDNNWVTFFVKSIIQDSAKKGYEKVLFPNGNTASKVEGHTTLEEFKKEKENRIKKLESVPKYHLALITDKTNDGILDSFVTKEQALSKIKENNIAVQKADNSNALTYELRVIEGKDLYANEINQLKQELERVETEGFGALRPIYNFYENTVTNILNKTYGKENIKQITDEYGNTWNEIILSNKNLQTIAFSKTKEIELPSDKALTSNLKNFWSALNIEPKIVDYLTNREGLIDPSLTAQAKITKVGNKVVSTIDYVKNNGTFNVLAEESAHIYTGLLGFDHPLYKSMYTKIVTMPEYEQVKSIYPELKTEEEVRFEAIGQAIKNHMVKITNNEPTDSFVTSWWKAVQRFLNGLFKDVLRDKFKKAAYDILEGDITAINATNAAEIEANAKVPSRLEVQDDVKQSYTKKRAKLYRAEKYQKISKRVKAETENKKELTKVQESAKSIAEIKEGIRKFVDKAELLTDEQLTIMAEHVQSGYLELSCSI